MTLGLDPSDYVKGQSQALVSLKQTGDQATSTAKEMQARGAQAAEFFSKVRNEALGLLTVLVGGKGLEAFTRDAVNGLSALGRSAHDIGIAVPQLAALRNMIQASGGDAEAATTSFQGLAQAMARGLRYGPSPELSTFLTQIGAGLNDPVDVVYSKFNAWAQGRKPEDVITTGQMGGLDIGTIREAEKPVAQFQQDMADALNRGVPTKAMTDDMQALQSSFLKAEQAATNLGNVMVDKFAPSLTAILNAITAFIEKHPDAAGAVGIGAPVAGGILGWLGLKKLLPGLFGGGGAAEAAAGAGGAGLFGWIAAAAATTYEGFHIGGLNNGEQADIDHIRREHPSGTPLPVRLPPNTTGRDKQAYDYFISQGWTPAQAAALAGNIRGESGFDETQVGDNGDAVGIGQWHPDRVQAILTGTGIDVRTAAYDKQLQAMQWELTHTEAGAGLSLRHADSTFDASQVLVSQYERSKNQTWDALKRSWFASHYASEFAGLPPGSLPDSTPATIAGAGPVHSTSTTSSQVHIGQIVIQTQATDAAGIAKDLGKSLKDYGYVAQANMGVF